MDSSGTSDSNADLCGHDLDWSCPKADLDRLHEELATCQNIIERYRRYVKHLNWHCHVYRKTLGALPAGFKVLSEVTADTESKRVPVCLDCEKDELLGVIAALNEEVGRAENATSVPTNEDNVITDEISPILSSKPHSRKRRRLDSRTSLC